MNDQTRVFVALDGETVPVGSAYFHHGRRQLATTFTYATDYLSRRRSYSIDPALPLSAAPITVQGLPGAFQDCSPDRWGRNLVQKEHRRRVARGTARDRTLTEVDYLLGVSDRTRHGALRFAPHLDAEFASPSSEVPKLLALPKLQRAADRVGRDDEDAIRSLLDAGSGSLGGARPKASVLGEDEHLMLAKFSHSGDEWSVIAWEKTAVDLADRAGIAVPRTTLLRVDQRPVLVLDRFDRVEGRRLGYMSAMTAARRTDGEPGDYLDLVEACEDLSSDFRRDQEDLLRRVALSVAIRNTDDHLRNHGFLRQNAGWELSPVFDINPQPDLKTHRQTAVNGVTDAEDEAEALLELARYCDVSLARAREIISAVLAAAGTWAEVARRHGIDESEIGMFKPVFTTQQRRLRKASDRP